RPLGLLAAIDAVEAALGLVAAGVVVDHRDAVDAPAHRGLHFADVVPEAGVTSEHHDRTLRGAALGAEAGRERPAQMPGAAHVALLRRAQIVHAAHPHAGMAGVGHHDGVVGHVLAQFGADALGPDRHRVGGEERRIFLAPFLADSARPLGPGLAP